MSIVLAVWHHFEFEVTATEGHPERAVHSTGTAHVVTDGSFPDNEETARVYIAKRHYYIERLANADRMPPEHVRGISEKIFQAVLDRGVGCEVVGWQ